MSRPVLDELDEISIDGPQNLVGDPQIRAFGTTADVVYLADIAVRPNLLDGKAVVLDVNPPPDEICSGFMEYNRGLLPLSIVFDPDIYLIRRSSYNRPH